MLEHTLCTGTAGTNDKYDIEWAVFKPDDYDEKCMRHGANSRKKRILKRSVVV